MPLQSKYEKMKKRLKKYKSGGVLGTAALELLILGKSEKALDIIRLIFTFKVKKKLLKRYGSNLNKFDEAYDYSAYEHISSNKIWFCWFQGLDQAPIIVKKCHESIATRNPLKDVIVITKDNMYDYVQFPDYIIKKFDEGNISLAHMSDLLRLELLIKYGGTWMDSTVYCSDSNIPEFFFDSELFFYQNAGSGQSTYLSNWYLNAKSNNRVLMGTRALLYEYWKENDEAIDYFLFHDFFSIVLDKYKDEWDAVIPRDNTTPHILQRRLFEQYDERIWNSVKAITPFHKLTYKYKKEDELRENTFFQKVLMDENIC